MTPVDFLTYCISGSIVLLATASAARIARRPSTTVQRNQSVVQSFNDVVPTPEEGFAKRLREFQEARFASPIVQRTTVAPPAPLAPVKLRPRGRSFSAPSQPITKPTQGKVVKLPTKHAGDNDKDDK